MLFSASANALPVEVGRVADVFANAIAYHDAKPVSEVELQPVEIPPVIAIAAIAPPSVGDAVTVIDEVVADTVARGAPVLASATLKDISPAIVTKAASAPFLEENLANVSSKRPRSREGLLPRSEHELGFVAAAFDIQPDASFLPDPPVAEVDITSVVEASATAEDVAEAASETAPEIVASTEDLVSFEAPVEDVVANSSDLLAEIANSDPNLTIRPGEDGEGASMMLLSDVLFQFGRAELAPEAEQTLAAIAGTLEGVGLLTVTGHTDSIGSEENNLVLGKARAEAVRDWLLQNSKLTEDTVLAKGIGEADPIAANVTDSGQDNPVGRAQNRRVEFAIN
jgi:outer membrane protein OmpA-like peptidoglycan-associated protein